MKLVVALKADIADCAVNVTIGRKVRVGRTTGTGEIAGIQRGQGRLGVLPKQATKAQQNVAMGRKRIFSAPPNLRNSSEGNSLRKVGDNLSAARISTSIVAQNEQNHEKPLSALT